MQPPGDHDFHGILVNPDIAVDFRASQLGSGAHVKSERLHSPATSGTATVTEKEYAEPRLFPSFRRSG